MNPAIESGVSIIICCYNSAKRLPETLCHLALQEVPDNIPWEILLVDNASNDNTLKIAQEIWANFALPHVDFRVLEELTPGKTFALEKAFKEARYEYLLTCDDDNWLSTDYVSTGFSILNSDESIGALGGLGILEVQEPLLLGETELVQTTAHGSQTWAAHDHWVYGAGSFYRNSLVNSLLDKGWNLICSGRTGSSLISGEDVEICFMMYLCGYKVVADDRLTFKHFVSVDKQNIKYLNKMAYWLSYSYYLLYAYLVILNNEKRSINNLSFILLSTHVRLVLKLIIRRAFVLRKVSLNKQILESFGMIRSVLQNRRKVILHNKKIRIFLKNNSPLLFGEDLNSELFYKLRL